MSSPFDPGLQGERTALAWTRTALALAIAGALIMRFTIDRLGVVALVLGSIAVALAAVMAMLARVRFVPHSRHTRTSWQLLRVPSHSLRCRGSSVSTFGRELIESSSIIPLELFGSFVHLANDSGTEWSLTSPLTIGVG